MMSVDVGRTLLQLAAEFCWTAKLLSFLWSRGTDRSDSEIYRFNSEKEIKCRLESCGWLGYSLTVHVCF